MPFKDLDELLVARKQLPIGGRLHDFPDRISAASGLVLLRLSQRAQADPDAAANADKIASELLDDAGWEALQTEVLGKPAEEFIADGLTGDHVSHVFKTLMTWHLHGQDAAEKAWEQVGNPPAPNRASRRATATSTRSRGSSSGTTTRKPGAKAKASPGRSSSATSG